MSLIPFEYGGQQVRVIDRDGEPWFVLADLCRVLEIANPSNVAARLDLEMVNTLRLAEGIRGNPNVTIVSEPGMYEVVIRSDKPEAAAFRRWVTSEVLPSIRKTGSFAVPESREQLLARAVIEAQAAIAEQTETIRVLTPKANYVDVFVADGDLRLLRNVAKSIGVGEERLRNALIEHQWIYAEDATRWSEKKQRKEKVYRYSPMADKRQYFTPVPVHDAPRFRGEVMHTLKVTPAGAEALARAAKRWGLVGASLEVIA